MFECEAAECQEVYSSPALSSQSVQFFLFIYSSLLFLFNDLQTLKSLPGFRRLPKNHYIHTVPSSFISSLALLFFSYNKSIRMVAMVKHLIIHFLSFLPIPVLFFQFLPPVPTFHHIFTFLRRISSSFSHV